MLFYTSLLLFCIAVSAIALWIYRSVYETGNTAYRAIFPAAKEEYKTKASPAVHTSVNSTPTPWGWSGDRGARRAIPTTAAHASPGVPAPWGWKGNLRNAESESHSLRGDVGEAAASLRKLVGGNGEKEKSQVGWPYREESFGFADREYKVTRKNRVKKTNMGKVSKPWGW